MELNLRQALKILSKESPFAVSTETEKHDDYSKLKDYLYIESDIEIAFKKRLENLKSDEILFLCGSSGDGKSEILTRYSKKYPSCHFHLDATHSFSPDESAIQALDKLFDDQKSEAKPLVVGINIGMLANYSKEGDQRHDDIKGRINTFLNEKSTQIDNQIFLDFEQFPKFNFSDSTNYSPFTKKLISQLTCPTEQNHFYKLFKAEEETGTDLRLLANFRLLQKESVQEMIITQLFKVRLAKDQFITTRSLLDFLYHILTGEQSLADNLFSGSENELLKQLSSLDPALIHSPKLDQLVLEYELGLSNPERDIFLKDLLTNGLTSEEKEESATSIIRLFMLLSSEEISNNYHQNYKAEFEENTLKAFSDIWQQHHDFDGDKLKRKGLMRFYNTQLIKAIRSYANRNAPGLPQAELFIGEYGGIKLTANVEIKADYDSIQNAKVDSCFNFYAFVKVADQKLSEAIPINLNVFDLILKLNNGYYPNKYDKSAIILIDEIVSQISSAAQSSNELKFHDAHKSYSAKFDDDMISISEGYTA